LKTYIEKLRDPRWQRKRLEILQAADWKCQSCHCADATLHVHHKLYVKGREPWEYDAEELAVLCEPCHEGYHEGIKSCQRLLALLPPIFFLMLDVPKAIATEIDSWGPRDELPQELKSLLREMLDQDGE
jgi:hypothetical protein